MVPHPRNCALNAEADRLEAFLYALVAQLQSHGIPIPDLDLTAIREEADLEQLAVSAYVIASITKERRQRHHFNLTWH